MSKNMQTKRCSTWETEMVPNESHSPTFAYGSVSSCIGKECPTSSDTGGVLEGVAEGVLDGVLVGVAEGVWDGVLEGVLEGVDEGVADGVWERVSVGVAEGVWDGVAEGVAWACFCFPELPVAV